MCRRTRRGLSSLDFVSMRGGRVQEESAAREKNARRGRAPTRNLAPGLSAAHDGQARGVLYLTPVLPAVTEMCPTEDGEFDFGPGIILWMRVQILWRQTQIVEHISWVAGLPRLPVRPF